MTRGSQKIVYPVELNFLNQVLLVVIGVATEIDELRFVDSLKQRPLRYLALEVDSNRRELAVLESPDSAGPDLGGNGDRLS